MSSRKPPIKPPTGTYEVGYGKPPLKHRFQPGTSGNPRGRRKKQPSPEETVARFMGGSISVTENGVSKKISRLEALIRQQFATAFKGNAPAANNILKMLRQHEAVTANQPEPLDLQDLSMEELVMLRQIKLKTERRAFDREVAALKKRRGLRD